MEPDEIMKLVDARLKALKRSDAKASRLAGHRDVVKNMRSKIKYGTGSWPKTTTLIDLATKGLEMDPLELFPELLVGGNGEPSDNSALERLRKQRDWHLREAEHLDAAIAFLERDKTG